MGLAYTFVRIVIMSVLLAVFSVVLKPFLESQYHMQFGLYENIIFFLILGVLAYILTWILVRPRTVVIQPPGR